MDPDQTNPSPEPPASPAPRATLRPVERVRRGDDFRRAFARRRAASGPRLVVHVAENDLGLARLGVVASRRLARRAVTRHRLKRLVREVFRLHKAEFPPGVDYVVVPRTSELTFAELRETLPKLAREAARRLSRSKPTEGPEAAS